ncbi:hypothetical protein [Methylobacter svalbardensis]|uniref:hypothetical protein n=1 Tax=Methylobacter svalbardensis TaxID=3080016 RepID=UPI0030EE782D
MHGTQPLLAGGDFLAIFRKPLEIQQVNLGYLHNSGAGACRRCNLHTLDLTGGAPEMRPHFHCMVCGSLHFHRIGFLVQH